MTPLHVPDPVPSLGAGDVHLWWIDLDACGAGDAFLSDDERARAGRFRFPHHRDHYVAAHGAMRSILSAYLGIDAQSLRFLTTAAGKPAMDPQVHGPAAPAFNLSHSNGHAALAVARDGSIGVDLEAPQRRPDRQGLLELLAPAERAAAESLDDAELAAAFLVAWTRKEACLKAIGSGFALRPQEFDVGLEPAPRAVTVPAAALRPGGASPPYADAGGSRAAVHVVSMQSPAGVPTSLARLGEPIGGLRTFTYPPAAAADDGPPR